MSLLHKAMMLLTIARARGFAARAERAPTTRLMSAAAWGALGLNSDMSDLVSKQWPESNAVSPRRCPLFKAGRRRRRRRRDRERQDPGLSITGGAARRRESTEAHALPRGAGARAEPRARDATEEGGGSSRRGHAAAVHRRKQALLARGAPRRRSARWPYAPGKAPDVLVATPSFAAAFDRDLDLWEGLSTLVLDEADMLLDGGFKKQLDRCLVALKRVERRREGNDDLVEDVPERCRRVVVAATLPNQGLRSSTAW